MTSIIEPAVQFECIRCSKPIVARQDTQYLLCPYCGKYQRGGSYRHFGSPRAESPEAELARREEERVRLNAHRPWFFSTLKSEAIATQTQALDYRIQRCRQDLTPQPPAEINPLRDWTVIE